MPPVVVSPPGMVGPATEAVALFEHAMEAMQRHSYGDAARLFGDLLSSYPGENALLDRTRVYLDLCRREMARRPVRPRTTEERLTAATAALNDGDGSRAEQFVMSVLAEEPRQDLALYLLAVIEARRGDADAALARLGDAIAVSPEAGAQARFDPDFEGLRGHERFRRLTNLSPNGDGARPRRSRSER